MKIDIIVVFVHRYARGHELDFVPPLTGIQLELLRGNVPADPPTRPEYAAQPRPQHHRPVIVEAGRTAER